MRIGNLFVNLLFGGALSATIASQCFASATAVGGLSTVTDSDLFVSGRSSGSSCIDVIAASVVNPGPAAVCSFDVDFITVNGKGKTAFKNAPSSTSGFANSATFKGTTSRGSSSWTYTFGTVFDRGDYIASAIVTPPPPVTLPPRYFAAATATDPLVFTSTASGTFGFGATLSQLDLSISELDLGTSSLGLGISGPTPTHNGLSGVGASFDFDGVRLFDFHVIAPLGFTGINDLDLSYTSILGPIFDSMMINTLRSLLVLDPGAGTVNLPASVDLFPHTMISYGPGSHELSGGLAAEAELAAVPEPGTLSLVGSGLMFLFGWLCLGKRNRNPFKPASLA